MATKFDLNERRHHEEEMIRTSCTRPWELAVQPVQAAPHVYYAGNSWVGVYWVDSGDGLILFDTGMPFQLYTIFESMRVMGYDPRDIKFVLLSHAHYDHCGAMRAVLEYSGAVSYASREDTPTLMHPDDSLLCFGYDYQPVIPDRLYEEGNRIELGCISVEPVLVGGHTPGTTCFFFDDRDENGNTYTVGIHGGLGLSPLSDAHFKTAGEAALARNNYRAAQAKLYSRKVDIPLSFHPYNLNILEKAAAGDWHALISPRDWTAMLDERLKCLEDIERDSIFHSDKE